jgi:hypothetical protein
VECDVRKIAALMATLFMGSCGVASAMKIDDLFFLAMEKGVAEATINEGDWALQLKNSTRSKDWPRAKIEKIGLTKDNCFIAKLTATQTNVPTTDGKIIGDYVAQTKVINCPGGASPRFNQPVEVLDCTIGGKSCMPPRF